MQPTLFLTDHAASVAAHNAMRSLKWDRALIRKTVQRDRDTHEINEGFTVKLVARDGGHSFV